MTAETNSKPCQTAEMELFSKLSPAAEEFRILPEIYEEAFMFLNTRINLKNVIKVFVSCSVRIQENTDQKHLRIWTLFTQCLLWYVYSKYGCFLNIFTYCSGRKRTAFFIPSISNQMSWGSRGPKIMRVPEVLGFVGVPGSQDCVSLFYHAPIFIHCFYYKG